MKKDMPLEGLRWSRDSGSALCDTSQNSRSRTGWGGVKRLILIELYCFRVLLFLYYSFKSTTIFRNRQENRGKVLEKITFEGYCISHLSYMHFSDITFVPLDLPRPTVYPIRIVYELVHFRNDV